MEPLDLTLSILKTKCVWQSESNFNAKHLGKKRFMGVKTWQCALNNHDISVPLGCNCGAREWEGRLGGEGGFHEGGWGEDVSVSCFLFYTLWYYLTSSSPYIYKTIKIAIVFSLSCPHISIDVMVMFFSFISPLTSIKLLKKTLHESSLQDKVRPPAPVERGVNAHRGVARLWVRDQREEAGTWARLKEAWGGVQHTQVREFSLFCD